jgi:hypothetical protein
MMRRGLALKGLSGHDTRLSLGGTRGWRASRCRGVSHTPDGRARAARRVAGANGRQSDGWNLEQLERREDAPVIPVALLFYQAAEGVAYEVYEETLFGHTIITFRYLQISLARLAPRAYDYLNTGNILAIALASIMGRSLRGTKRAQLYFDCLRRLLDAARAGEVNQATTRLLGAVIDTYLPRARELSNGPRRPARRRGVWHTPVRSRSRAYAIRPYDNSRAVRICQSTLKIVRPCGYN